MAEFIKHPVFKKGTPSDHVLEIMKRTNRKLLSTAEVGKNENGKIVKWFLEECVITFRRWKEGEINCYRVYTVEKRKEPDAIRLKPGSPEFEEVTKKLEEFQNKEE